VKFPERRAVRGIWSHYVEQHIPDKSEPREPPRIEAHFPGLHAENAKEEIRHLVEIGAYRGRMEHSADFEIAISIYHGQFSVSVIEKPIALMPANPQRTYTTHIQGSKPTSRPKKFRASVEAGDDHRPA
jgi:hypothetical protein